MSWGQFVLLHRGYWKKEDRLWEDRWRQTRELYWLTWNSNVTQEDQQTRHELMPLPSDPAPKFKKLTPEQEHELFFAAMSVFAEPKEVQPE
jgi:hypothetical protein